MIGSIQGTWDSSFETFASFKPGGNHTDMEERASSSNNKEFELDDHKEPKEEENQDTEDMTIEQDDDDTGNNGAQQELTIMGDSQIVTSETSVSSVTSATSSTTIQSNSAVTSSSYVASGTIQPSSNNNIKQTCTSIEALLFSTTGSMTALILGLAIFIVCIILGENHGFSHMGVIGLALVGVICLVLAGVSYFSGGNSRCTYTYNVAPSPTSESSSDCAS